MLISFLFIYRKINYQTIKIEFKLKNNFLNYFPSVVLSVVIKYFFISKKINRNPSMKKILSAVFSNQLSSTEARCMGFILTYLLWNILCEKMLYERTIIYRCLEEKNLKRETVFVFQTINTFLLYDRKSKLMIHVSDNLRFFKIYHRQSLKKTKQKKGGKTKLNLLCLNHLPWDCILTVLRGYLFICSILSFNVTIHCMVNYISFIFHH